MNIQNAETSAATLGNIVEVSARVMREVIGNEASANVAGNELNLQALYDLSATRIQHNLIAEGKLK